MARLSTRVLLPLLGVTLYACAFDWDTLDPRVTGTSGGGAGFGGSPGGSPGTGGIGLTGGGGDGGSGGIPCDASMCPQPTDECEVATCFDDVCDIGPAPDGTPCTQDDVFCNGAEVCTAGACVSPGDPCPVGDDDNCSEGCDEASGSCTALEPKDTPCDDGLYCNGTDACNPQGACTQHFDPPCDSVFDADCAGACDEDNDNCNLTEPNGSVCDDGTYCNGSDSCSNGTCTIHAGNPCPGPDGDSDCSETCNENAEACTANDPNGTECNGIADTICCSAGQCTANNGC